MTRAALVPLLIEKSEHKIITNILSVICGVFLISALAQVVIPLPWTPVPITGQTFGVALIALSWGRARGLATIVSYIALGAIGLPIFAAAQSGLSVGPTLGYLLGMVAASYVVGGLADRGWTGSFKKTLAAAFLGSLFIFGFGLITLSFFVPKSLLLGAGLFPFLPGDLIKNTLAATISWKTRKTLQ